jgi:hypothetical protein
VIDRDGKIKEWHVRVDARAWSAEVINAIAGPPDVLASDR